MGRRKLYKTEEERLAAMRARSKKYYRRHRNAICEAKKARYGAKVAEREIVPPLPPLPLTDEERKVKNRLKSQRYYQRNKSEIKLRRQNKSAAGVQANAENDASQKQRRIARNSWEQRLFDFSEEFKTLLSERDIKSYLEDVTKRYLREGLRSILNDEYPPLESLRGRVEALRSEILNNLGAAAEMSECSGLLRDINAVFELLEDVEIVIIGEGRGSLMEKYIKQRLLYQRRYRPR